MLSVTRLDLASAPKQLSFCAFCRFHLLESENACITVDPRSSEKGLSEYKL